MKNVWGQRKKMDQLDGMFLIYAGSCVAGGAVMYALTGKQYWFALGSVLGAGVVGGRLYYNRMPRQSRKVKLTSSSPPQALGAPEIPAVDAPVVPASPLNAYDSADYPYRHRVPDCEMHMDTMDDRIRPHFTGPLGPENDPVRHW